MTGEDAWSTAREIDYIRNQLDGIPGIPMSRETVLMGYIASIPKRADWSNMDKKAIEAAAKDRLRELMRPAKPLK